MPREDPLQAHLEHPAVGGTGQRVALGEVLDAPQQHGIPKVERGDGAELAQDRAEPARDAGHHAAAELHDDGADGLAVRDHRGDEDVAGVRQGVRQHRVRGGIQPAECQGLAPLPGEPDDVVRVGGKGRDDRRAVGREDDRPAVARADDDTAPEAEAIDDAVEDDPRLADRIGDIVQLGAQLHEGLEVGPAEAELALVEGREGGRCQGEEPERRHVQHGHALELEALTGDHVDGRHELRGLGVEDNEQQERVPESDLQAGAVRRKQRHADEVEEHEEAERALGRAGRIHRPGEEHAIDEEHQAQDEEAAPSDSPPEPLPAGGGEDVGDAAGDHRREGNAEELGPDGGPGHDDRRHREAEHEELQHPLAQGGELAAFVRPEPGPDRGHARPSSRNGR